MAHRPTKKDGGGKKYLITSCFAVAVSFSDFCESSWGYRLRTVWVILCWVITINIYTTEHTTNRYEDQRPNLWTSDWANYGESWIESNKKTGREKSVQEINNKRKKNVGMKRVKFIKYASREKKINKNQNTVVWSIKFATFFIVVRNVLEP